MTAVQSVSTGQLASPNPRRTILGFAKSCLEVVEREIAHLVFQAVEIHLGEVHVVVVVCRCGRSGIEVAAINSTCDADSVAVPPSVSARLTRAEQYAGKSSTRVNLSESINKRSFHYQVVLGY